MIDRVSYEIYCLDLLYVFTHPRGCEIRSISKFFIGFVEVAGFFTLISHFGCLGSDLGPQITFRADPI